MVWWCRESDTPRVNWRVSLWSLLLGNAPAAMLQRPINVCIGVLHFPSGEGAYCFTTGTTIDSPSSSCTSQPSGSSVKWCWQYRVMLGPGRLQTSLAQSNKSNNISAMRRIFRLQKFPRIRPTRDRIASRSHNRDPKFTPNISVNQKSMMSFSSGGSVSHLRSVSRL